MGKSLTQTELRETVEAFIACGRSVNKAAAKLKISQPGCSHRLAKAREMGLYSEDERADVFREDKAICEVGWREMSDLSQKMQAMNHRLSSKQGNAVISIKTPYKRVLLLPLSDIHIGSGGSCYDVLESLTDLLLQTPYMYIATHGDLTDNFINFFSKAAMFSQILNPKQQQAFLRSWLEEVQHKMLYAAWGNHEEFEEKLTGNNAIHDLLSRRVTFLEKIAHVQLKLNKIQYDIAVTHRTRFNSSFNETHGLRQLARKDLPNCDIYLTGDKHTPSYSVAWERDREQVFMMTGTFKREDTYSGRYYAYMTHVEFPCLVLDTEQKRFTPFSNIAAAMDYCEAK